MTSTGDRRSAVLVGVGTANEAAEAAELMVLAVQRAADDAGARSLLAAVDRIAVPMGTWAYTDPARLVAVGIGAGEAETHAGEIGVSQQTLVSQALRAIVAGTSEVAVVVGGEARSFGRDGGIETEQRGPAPDVVHTREPEYLARPEIAAGLTSPVQQYAMIDNALRHAEGRSVDQQRDEIAELWARCNVVARGNPLAAFPDPRSAADIANPGPKNRPLSFPYNKWHASQWTVDQAAALIICSVEAARRHRVPTDRWIFPLVGIDASHSVSLSRRHQLHTWPAMGVLGRAAAGRIGRPLTDVEVTEVYSCFPAAVRVQQRELGLPGDGTPTVTGGMTFAGGPFNNFTYQATAAVVPRLRRAPGSLGLITTVSGLLTKPGLAVWSSNPDGRSPLICDLAEAVATASVEVEVLDTYHGEATVVSYTVTPEDMVPARVVILAQTPDGRRCVAASEDSALATAATVGEFIGTPVQVRGGSFSL